MVRVPRSRRISRNSDQELSLRGRPVPFVAAHGEAGIRSTGGMCAGALLRILCQARTVPAGQRRHTAHEYRLHRRLGGRPCADVPSVSVVPRLGSCAGCAKARQAAGRGRAGAAWTGRSGLRVAQAPGGANSGRRVRGAPPDAGAVGRGWGPATVAGRTGPPSEPSVSAGAQGPGPLPRALPGCTGRPAVRMAPVRPGYGRRGVSPGPCGAPPVPPTFRTPPSLAFVDHGSAGSGEPAVGLLWCRHPAPHNWAPKCGRLFSRCSSGIIPPPSHCPCCPCSRRSSARSSSSRCSRALCHQGQKSVLPPSGACLPSMAARAFAATIHRRRFSARPPARGRRHGRPRGREGRRPWPGSRPVRRLHEVVGSLAAGGESFPDLPASYVRTGRMGRQRFWELRH
ncbi:hypothetical protein EES37_17305 [Streptomyces sp. ADI91-18]|nr:hypothetical protein EES37_17305 [Streptomyces sp. ADI91-18]